jgi:hypothetical protein
MIEPSEIEPGMRLYPCSARLDDGTVQKCIYFVARETSKRLFGQERPEDIPGFPWVSPEEIASVAESPFRLPARFANQIYRAGESRMGCYIFTLVFSAWCKRHYLVGGFVDFLLFPRGRTPLEIREVLLHRGAKRSTPVPPYKWCILPSIGPLRKS